MLIELASLPSATSCSVCGSRRRIRSPYAGGMARAIQARPSSRYGSMFDGLATTPTTVKFCDAENRAMRSRLVADRSASATTMGTWRTSVVAAYPSMNSWMIGAAMTITNNRGSALSSISSFQTRNATRRISGPLPLQPDRGQRQYCQGEHDERRQLDPVHVQPGTFQDNPAQRDEEVSRRDNVGDELQEPRHAGDRKDEARQHQRWQKRR